MNYFKLTLALSFFALISCGGKNSSDKAFGSIFSKSEMESNYPDFKENVLSDSIRSFFQNTTAAKGTAVDSFYRLNEYKPVWTKDIFNSPALDSLMSYLHRVSEHGLNPDVFRVQEMGGLLDSLRHCYFGQQMPAVYGSMGKLECMATQAYVSYTTGLRYGFVHPQKLLPKDYFIKIQSPDSTYNSDMFSYLLKDPYTFLQLSQPTDKNYLKLQGFLKEYDELQKVTFDSITVKKGAKNYVLGQKDPMFPRIAKRLMITGELLPVENADSVYANLNQDLLDAINFFRVNNSYPEDKEVGEATLQSLSRPFSYYYKTIQANLERARWKRVTPASEKYAEVNVAAFILQAFEPNQDPIKMNVCVGIAYRNQTPLLESEIYYINLNPKWSVPSSIVEKELYGAIKRDSTYLRRHGMKVLDRKGGVVNPSSIDWNSVSPKRFPYMIRQDSGDGNSLGRIKFMFDNPFSVYLHDTPSKKNFSYKNRAVSHGCVRIQRPMDFAFFCLAQKDSVFFDRIRYSIDQAPASVEGKKLAAEKKLKKLEDIVRLDTNVPLTINYYTVYPLPDEKFYFADDVYGFDKKIRQAMNIQ